MDRLSHSQLNGATGCGERYRLERLIEVPQTPSWALIGGSTVHEVTESIDLRDHGVDVPELDFRDHFETLTAQREEESGMDRSEFRASGRASREWPNKENAEWWLANGPAMVRRWVVFTQNTPWLLWLSPPDARPGIEINFALELEGLNILVRGGIDRVVVDPTTGRLIVVDIKTGASKQSSLRQLGTYKVALEQRFGVDVAGGTFWDARSGVADPVRSLDQFTLERLRWQYETLAQVRRQGLFLPNPGPMCNACSVRSHCYEQDGELAHTVPKPWEMSRTEGDRVELVME
jgi:hypothetical protein